MNGRRAVLRLCRAGVLLVVVAACSSGGGAPAAGGSAGAGGGGGNTSTRSDPCKQADLALGYVNSNFQNRTIDKGDVHAFALAARDALRTLKDKAPAAQQAGLNTVADTFNTFAEQTTGLSYNPASGGTLPAQFTTAVQVFQQPDFLNVVAPVEAYIYGLCQ